MRSWVFRHRARLRVIYGLPPQPPRALPPAPPGSPAPSGAPATGAGAAGTLTRRSRYVVLHPMRRGS